MKAQSMTKQELLKENAFLRQKIRELEQSESERKHADASLQESEERFKKLFDHMADGVAVYQGVDDGQDFVFVDINRAGQFLSKIHLDEAVGKRITEVFPSVERMGLLDVFRRVWRTGQPEHHPLTEYADDRIVQWVENYVFRLQSGLVATIYSNTSEKHRVEEQLRRSEENFRRSFDDSPLGVRIVTEEGETIYVNRAILNIYGYDSLEDFRTIPVKKRYTPECYADYLIRREKRQQGIDTPPEYEISIVRKDGEICHLKVFRKEILWDGKIQFQVIYNDITERKKTEEALKKSVALHKEAQRVARIGHWELEADIGTPVWSEEIFRIFGLDPCEGEPSFTDHETHVHPEDWPILNKAVRKARSEGTPFDVIFRIIKPGGELGWMHVIGTTTQDDKGHVTKLFGTAQDITALRQMEKALREKDLKLSHLADELELIMDGVSGLIFFKDTENRFIRINKFFADALQMTKKQLEGRSCFEIFPNKMAQAYFEDDLEVIRNRRPKLNIEEEWETAYGTRCVNTSKIPYLNDKGEVSGVIGLSLDITERKNAEKSLRESEAFAHSTLDGLSAHIAIIDEFGVIVAVNRSWREFADENPPVRGNVCEGANYLDICDGAPSEAPEAAKFAEAIRYILHGSAEKFEMEYACNSPEEQRWFVGRVTRFPDSTLPRVVVAHENITERKEAEEKLKASQQQLRDLAERLQQIREEERLLFSREIHDIIGGGLTGLKMDLSWLIHNVKNAESDKEQAVFKSRIVASSEFVDQMIQETRRISSGLRPPFIDDLGLIPAIDWQLSEFTGRTGILHELTTQFEHVNMEKEKVVGVFRIFQEMLTNIVRHSRATKVIVVLREGDERSLFGDENLVLEIRDNGRGISEEEILNKKSLGLLGMKERATIFGGELSIRGEPGGGTTLVLKIPRKKGEQS